MKVEFELTKAEAEGIFTRAFVDHFKMDGLRITSIKWSDYIGRVEVYGTNAPPEPEEAEEAA